MNCVNDQQMLLVSEYFKHCYYYCAIRDKLWLELNKKFSYRRDSARRRSLRRQLNEIQSH